MLKFVDLLNQPVFFILFSFFDYGKENRLIMDTYGIIFF